MENIKQQIEKRFLKIRGWKDWEEYDRIQESSEGNKNTRKEIIEISIQETKKHYEKLLKEKERSYNMIFQRYSEANKKDKKLIGEHLETKEAILKKIDKLQLKVKKEGEKSDLSFFRTKKEIFDEDTKCFINYLEELKKDIVKEK